MAAAYDDATPVAEGAGGAGQSWPKSSLAWYAVVILALVLMLGRMESQIINYLIKPINATFSCRISR